MNFFDEPAAVLPSAGVVICIAVFFAVGCDPSVTPGTSDVYLFFGAIGIIAAALLIAGGSK